MKSNPWFTTFNILALLLVGCNSSPLTIEEHGAPIAQQAGSETDASKLNFFSYGHFTPAGFVTERYRFGPDSKGTIALTSSSLLWRDFGSTANYDLNIRINSLQGVSYHRGYLQLKFEERVYVLKPTLANPFKNTSNHTAQLYDLLRNREVPELALKSPFRPRKASARSHSYDQNEIYDRPGDIGGQDRADQASFDHVHSYGENGGVPLTPH